MIINRTTINFLLVITTAFTACESSNNNSSQQKSIEETEKNTSTQIKFLFDNTKAEKAGNADWVIDEDDNLAKRFPTPDQKNISSSTNENYFTGALSSWGIALVKLKYTIETLQQDSRITFNDQSNKQDLSNYTVFIVDEPNIRFKETEKTAIINFIKNGGGLFMISDHNHSDRNNDSWDSPAIWNDLMDNNSIQKDPFGFSIYPTNISQQSFNVTNAENLITQGLQGKVSSLQFNNGTTITLTSAAAKGLFWMNNYPQNNTHVLVAYSTFGKGKIVVIGDSSPADDGTGAKGNKLHDGWHASDDANFFINASLWLAKVQ